MVDFGSYLTVLHEGDLSLVFLLFTAIELGLLDSWSLEDLVL
jgi:hypothetical protein